jgi:hypothetical protein
VFMRAYSRASRHADDPSVRTRRCRALTWINARQRGGEVNASTAW